MNPFRILDKLLAKRSRNVILLLSLALALIIGAADALTSVELLVLYVVPVYLAAWYGGARAGNVVAIYCAGAALFSRLYVTGLFHGEPLDPALVWSFVARLIVFLIIVRVVARLRQTMRQREEMSRFIVHDLRSPISSAISGLMTLEQTATALDETEREMVELALVSNKRALDLVNAILDVAKLEDGKLVVEKCEIDLHALASACVDQVGLWARANEIDLHADIHADKWRLDETLTSRIIVNLLSNALKFSPAKSKVVLKIVAIGHHLEVTVADHGPGIPADFVDTIFDPFSQVKGARGGTGLGLTFCRLAVHAQGGKIWVDTAQGKGTTMKFTLPI